MDGRLSTGVRCRYMLRSFTSTIATGASVSVATIGCDDADICFSVVL